VRLDVIPVQVKHVQCDAGRLRRAGQVGGLHGEPRDRAGLLRHRDAGAHDDEGLSSRDGSRCADRGAQSAHALGGALLGRQVRPESGNAFNRGSDRLAVRSRRDRDRSRKRDQPKRILGTDSGHQPSGCVSGGGHSRRPETRLVDRQDECRATTDELGPCDCVFSSTNQHLELIGLNAGNWIAGLIDDVDLDRECRRVAWRRVLAGHSRHASAVGKDGAQSGGDVSET
jgi:hypothetical protein